MRLVFLAGALKAVQSILKLFNAGKSVTLKQFSILPSEKYPFELSLSFKADGILFKYSIAVQEAEGEWTFPEFLKACYAAKIPARTVLVHVAPENEAPAPVAKVPGWYKGIIKEEDKYSAETKKERGVTEEIDTDGHVVVGATKELLATGYRIGGGFVVESFTLPDFKGIPAGSTVTVNPETLEWGGTAVNGQATVYTTLRNKAKKVVIHERAVGILRKAKDPVRITVWLNGVTLFECGDYGFIASTDDGSSETEFEAAGGYTVDESSFEVPGDVNQESSC